MTSTTPRAGSVDRLRRPRDKRPVGSRAAPRRKSTPLDRRSMFLMEANEISQCLQKHYTFVKAGDADGDDPDAMVKVINKKLSVSCLWPVSKLKERLIRMRKLVYQSDTETSSLSADAVFFDPADTWVKESCDWEVELRYGGKPNAATTSTSTPRSHTASPSSSSTSASPVPGLGRSGNRESEQLPRPFDDCPGKKEEPERDPCGAASPRVGLHLRRSKSELPSESHYLPGEKSPTVDTPVLSEKYLTGSAHEQNGSSGAPTNMAHAQDGRRVRGATLRRGRTIKQDSREGTANVRQSLKMVNGHGRDAEPDVNGGLSDKESQKMKAALVGSTVGSQTILPPTTPALTTCRHMVEAIRDRLQNGPDRETLLEKVLYNCECIKEAVINILELHAQGQDSHHGVFGWSDTDVMRSSSLHLVAALDNLTSHLTCWIAALPESVLAETFVKKDDENSRFSSRIAGDEYISVKEGLSEEEPAKEDPVKNAQCCMTAMLEKLASDLSILLQFAEQDDDSEVNDTASRIFDHIYDICRKCGELCISVDEKPQVLWTTERQSLEELMTFETKNKNDPFRPRPGSDIKQAFLNGSDVLVERALVDTFQTAADCEEQIRALSNHKEADESSEDILKHMYVVVATTKVLIRRAKQVQSDLSKVARDDPDQPDHHYDSHFSRNSAVLTHASQLSDALTLLGQAASTMVIDGEPSDMRKVGRCGEIVLKSCCRLAAVPGITGESLETGGRPRSTTPSSNLNGLLSPRVKGKLCVSLSIDAKSDNPIVAALLTKSQTEGLERAVIDVNTALTSLINAIHCHLPADLSNSRTRRMLPVVPQRPLGRSNSAKQAPSKRRLSRDLTSMHLRRSQEV